MDFSKDTSAGYLLNHLSRLFARDLQQAIGPLGLTPGVFPALLALWEQDGRTQKNLVEELDIEQATMANTLSRMERDGLIVRKPDQADGRRQLIWLTDHARALRHPATQAAMQVNAQALAHLSEAQREALLSLLQALRTGLLTR